MRSPYNLLFSLCLHLYPGYIYILVPSVFFPLCASVGNIIPPINKVLGIFHVEHCLWRCCCWSCRAQPGCFTCSPAETLGSATLGSTRIRKPQNSGLWLSIVLVPFLHGNAHGLFSPSHLVPSSVLLLPQLQFSGYTASKLAPEVAPVLQA